MFKILILLFVTILALCSVRSDQGVMTKAGTTAIGNEVVENQLNDLTNKTGHLQKRISDFKRSYLLLLEKAYHDARIDLLKEDDKSDPSAYKILSKMNPERPNCVELIEFTSNLLKQQESFEKGIQKQLDSLGAQSANNTNVIFAQLAHNLNKTQETLQQIIHNSQSNVKDMSNGINKNLEEIGNSELTKLDNLTMQMKNIEYSVAQSINNLQSIVKDIVNKNLEEIGNSQLTILNNLTTQMKNIKDSVAPKSCVEAVGNSNLSGIFNVQLITGWSSVYCHKDGWLRIQQQFDGPLSFNRSWLDYRNGFGDPNGQYWMGLENIRQITKQKSHELYITMTDFKNIETFARYDDFLIGSEAEKYRLKKLGEFSGNSVDDKLDSYLNMDFSTFDSDNDLWHWANCAQDFGSGWWFNNCGRVNLNESVSNSTGLVPSWNKYSKLKHVEMYIRMK